MVRNATRARELNVVIAQDHLIFVWTEEEGLRADEEEGNGEAAKREGVGEDHGLPIHHYQTNEEKAQNRKAKTSQYVNCPPLSREL